MTVPLIDSYRFGRLVVNGQPYTKDVILLPDEVLSNWWRREGHALQPEDLEPVMQAKPQVLVVGQGSFGRMRVTPETRQALRAKGIELIAQSTEEACRSYNQLCTEQRVAAALHLTC